MSWQNSSKITEIHRHDSRLEDRSEAGEGWTFTQGGFRSECNALDTAQLAFQGDLYGGSDREQVGDDLEIVDLSAHYRFPIGDDHDAVMGAGLR